MALAFLDSNRYDSLLEIGFGSGVLLPELAKYSKKTLGIDIHSHIKDVKKMTLKENVNAALSKGSIVELPYKNNSFDCIISVATIEHIVKLSQAVGELKRILKRDGLGILGFPVANKLSDMLLVLTGSLRVYKKELKEIHPNTHRDILEEIKKQFDNIKVSRFPAITPLDFSLYCCCMFKKI
jgi:ubiquinone/menaquinone biosynthesis C-methylase UbiE